VKSKDQFIRLVAVIVVGDPDNILAGLAVNSYRLGTARKCGVLSTACRA
jgi:hypothetical protein